MADSAGVTAIMNNHKNFPLRSTKKHTLWYVPSNKTLQITFSEKNIFQAIYSWAFSQFI